MNVKTNTPWKAARSWFYTASAAVLLAMGTQTQAVAAELSVDYTCTYPLIGDQPLTADITADIPDEVPANEATGEFNVDVLATAKGDTRDGIELVGAQSIEGEAIAASNLAGNSLDLDVDVPVTIPQQDIPEGEGSFQLDANGSTPSLTFTEDNEGDVVITVGNMDMTLLARDADGNPVQFPNSDPDTGEFPVPCTLDEGQPDTLHTMEITTTDPVVPDIDVTPEELGFDGVQQGTSATETVTVANVGGAPLGVNSITLGGANADAFMQSNNCTTVDPGNECQVEVTFFAEGEGNRSATLSIDSNDPDPEESVVDVPVTGTSEIPDIPKISVTPSELDFGEVEQPTTETVTVESTGTGSLDVTNVGITGSDAARFTQTNDCAQVPEGETCVVDVTYDPGSQDQQNATLTIDSNADNNPSLDVALSGQLPDSGPGVEMVLDLEGETDLRKLHRPIPLAGMVDANVDLATGMVEADLDLEPTTATLKLPFIKLYVGVAFEQVEQTTGTFDAGNLTTESRMHIVLTEIRTEVFGFEMPIGGGENCRTMDPALIELQNPDDQPFDLQEGGPVAGEYTIPPVDNCGGLEGLINPIMSGDGNTIELDLTPKDNG